MEHVLSIYVGLGIPAMLGTLLVLNRALDFRERLERRRSRREIPNLHKKAG